MHTKCFLLFHPSVSASVLTVRYNTLLVNSGPTVGVSRVVVHPNWNSNTIDSDVAVLQLASPLTLGQPQAAAVALPAQGSDPEGGADARVTGWGRLSGGGSLPTNLQTLNKPIFARSSCQSNWGSQVNTNMVCAFNPSNTGLSACNVIE